MTNVVCGIVELGSFRYRRGIGEREFCMVVDRIRMLDGPTPLQSARPMAFVAMAVESECLLLLKRKFDVQMHESKSCNQ